MGLRHYLRLLRVFFSLSIQGDAAYRSEFFARLIGSLYAVALAAVNLWIFFTHTDTIAGWSLGEIIVLLGVFHTIGGVVRAILAPNLQRMVEEVRSGALDLLLTKPGSSQFLVSFRSIMAASLAECVLGVVAVAAGMWHLGVEVGVRSAIFFPVAVAAGLVIIYSLWIFLTTLVFWFVRIANVTQIFWSLFEAGRFPLDIYPGWLRVIVTYIVPVAVITTVPAQGVAGRLLPLNLALFVAAAAAAFYLSSKFWQVGVRAYTSASS